MRPCAVFAVVALALLSLGCVSRSAAIYESRPAQARDESDRTDCDAIFGTAFRSAAERHWFEESCSGWEAAPVTEAIEGNDEAGRPATAEAEDWECSDVRGRRYESPRQREWYLGSCLEAGRRASGPDRDNCGEIRGTRYRSEAERDWFRDNCR